MLLIKVLDFRIASLPAARNRQRSRLVLRLQGRRVECGSFAVSSTKPLTGPQLIVFHCRYNITTGLYPFEGDNIYRLLENIGKGVWSVPEGLDPLLTDLLLNMLRFDPNERFTIQKIRKHAWFISSPVCTGDAIPVPPLRGDSLRSSTVLPYLESYHYENRQNQNVFFTEHDLNGEFYESEGYQGAARSLPNGWQMKVKSICRARTDCLECFRRRFLIAIISSFSNRFIMFFSRRLSAILIIQPANQQKA